MSGKNTMAITRRHGSWVVLGVLVTDADLAVTHADPESRAWDACGECRACIDACPTGAILEEGVLDARRCLSYLSQSRLEELPFAEAFEDRVYGCDICQDVCPWNRGAERRAAGAARRTTRTMCSRGWPTGWSRRPTRWPSATAGCTCPTSTDATCSATPGSRWRTSAARRLGLGGRDQRLGLVAHRLAQPVRRPSTSASPRCDSTLAISQRTEP